MDIVISDNMIFLHGGTDLNQLFSDVWSYNIQQNIWFKMPFYYFYNKNVYAGFNFNFTGHQFIYTSDSTPMMVMGSGIYSDLKTKNVISTLQYTVGGVIKISASVNSNFQISINDKQTKLINQKIQFSRDECKSVAVNIGICYWGRLVCQGNKYRGSDCD